MQHALLPATASALAGLHLVTGGNGAAPSAVPTVPRAFRAALPLLGDRCTAILYARCVCTPPVPVRVLAAHFGVSTPRIRQLEDDALRR
ncbi:MAG TPA: hypothetical protein VIU62_21525, partial [Chloroflexota bacterium]